MKFWGQGSGVYGRGRWRDSRGSADTPSSLKRLLVVQFGQLGDSVLSLPALDFLRDRLPATEMTIGCGMPMHELIDLWGRADRIVPLDRVKTRDTNRFYAAWLICQFVSRIWRPTPDAVLVLHPNDEMNLVAYCTGARRRAGLVVRRTFFSRLLNEPLEGAWKAQHAAASYMALVRSFCGLAPFERDIPVPLMKLPQPVERNGRVAIHVGGSRKQKRMAPESWLEVARSLRAKTGKEIVFISGPEEPELAAELARAMDGAKPLSGLDIEQLAVEVARSGFFVGTDSGPGHLAAALETPSLTLIEQHVAPRYHTLGPVAQHIRHTGIRDLEPRRIVEATLSHPAFPKGEAGA